MRRKGYKQEAKEGQNLKEDRERELEVQEQYLN